MQETIDELQRQVKEIQQDKKTSDKQGLANAKQLKSIVSKSKMTGLYIDENSKKILNYKDESDLENQERITEIAESTLNSATSTDKKIAEVKKFLLNNGRHNRDVLNTRVTTLVQTEVDKLRTEMTTKIEEQQQITNNLAQTTNLPRLTNREVQVKLEKRTMYDVTIKEIVTMVSNLEISTARISRPNAVQKVDTVKMMTAHLIKLFPKADTRYLKNMVQTQHGGITLMNECDKNFITNLAEKILPWCQNAHRTDPDVDSLTKNITTFIASIVWAGRYIMIRTED